VRRPGFDPQPWRGGEGKKKIDKCKMRWKREHFLRMRDRLGWQPGSAVQLVATSAFGSLPELVGRLLFN
jgi:hypothetical protein